MATIFVRIGGVRHLLGLLTAESGEISAEAKAEAAGALSTLAQNNPETQHMLMNNNLIRRQSGSGAASDPEEIIEGGVIATLQRVFLTTRSEEHTSELQSLMRISYAVLCLTKKQNK